MKTPNYDTESGEFPDPQSGDAVQILNRKGLAEMLVARGGDPELAAEFAREALAPGETLPILQTSTPVEPEGRIVLAEIGSKLTEMSKAELAAELDRKKTPEAPKTSFANIIEHAQDVANRTGKTVLTMKQLKGESFEGKVTSTDVVVGTDRLATVEGDKAVLLVRCSTALRANQGRDVQVKSGERGASVRYISKDLSR